MIWQLYDAVAAFAYYEVLPEKETPEAFTKTCAVIFEKDKQRKPLPRFLTVDSKGFVRLVRAAIRPIAKKMNRKLDSGEWEDGWRIVMETDHLNEGLQVALVGCPIYHFAVKGHDVYDQYVAQLQRMESNIYAEMSAEERDDLIQKLTLLMERLG